MKRHSLQPIQCKGHLKSLFMNFQFGVQREKGPDFNASPFRLVKSDQLYL